MAEYRKSAHAVYDIKYHVIWITKYRYKVLRGRVAERARDLIRQICAARGVVIVRGAVSPDHIHILVVGTAGDVAIEIGSVRERGLLASASGRI